MSNLALMLPGNLFSACRRSHIRAPRSCFVVVVEEWKAAKDTPPYHTSAPVDLHRAIGLIDQCIKITRLDVKRHELDRWVCDVRIWHLGYHRETRMKFCRAAFRALTGKPSRLTGRGDVARANSYQRQQRSQLCCRLLEHSLFSGRLRQSEGRPP